MYYFRGQVELEPCDRFFIEKFGLAAALDMVSDFTAERHHVFIYDTYMLADRLGVSRRALFALCRGINGHYTRVELPKAGGGVRVLRVPEKELREIQRRIVWILQDFPVSPAATAYHKGAQLRDNAAPHCGKKYLLKLDLADFFGHISFSMIRSTVFNVSHFPTQIGTMLAKLCCWRDVLAQGAPSSPIVSNLVMKLFDDEMTRWCASRGVSYTRYCDDLTFSADRPLNDVYRRARRLLEKSGFELNDKKTHFVTASARQTVTGLTVNEAPAVPREARRALRQEIYYVEKFGAADAILRGGRTDFVTDGVPDVMGYLDHLAGRVNYVLQIDPQNEAFWKLADELRARGVPIRAPRGADVCAAPR